MILEVSRQIENTEKALLNPNKKLVESIESRDDYIDNLKSVIENKCFSAIHKRDAVEKRTVDLLRAVNTIGSNLERIADFAVNIVSQMEYLQKPKFIKRYRPEKFFEEVNQALSVTYQAVMKQDVALAFNICRSELTLDLLYKLQFDRILTELRSGRETENLITSHLILRYLERMGDSLMNIGEAIIFAAVGEKFKIHQYEALKETLVQSGMEAPMSEVEFHSIWGTRSGCRIGKVDAVKNDKGEDKQVTGGLIFKEGNRKKMLLEKENIEHWEALMPGLPPQVVAHKEEGNQASLLIEYLGGCTYQDVVLSGATSVLQNAAFLIEQTLMDVWEYTRAEAPTHADFVSQIRSRMDDVVRLHPNLPCHPKILAGVQVDSLEQKLDILEGIQEQLPAPYTVYIHGDYNINNIVYDHEQQRIHYIDLHRSKMSDPLQDISVFLVSNFRLPVFDQTLRSRLNWAAVKMFRFAEQYAIEHGDACFHARLSLGLVRSFITSTRFELNPRFAKEMYMRGNYVLDRLIQHQGSNWEDFRISDDIFRY